MPPVIDLPIQRASSQPVLTIPVQFRPQLPLSQSPPPTTPYTLYTLAVPAQPIARAVSFSKEVATIAKIYTDDQKYSRVSNSFDFKLTIFYDICNRSSLPHEGYMTAFPTMLKGLA
jgi:hypothetical protein